MAQKFIGAEVRAGQFTDKATGKLVSYNNLKFQVADEVAGNCGVLCPLPIKIKNTREEILKVFGQPITMQWLKERLGWWCDVFYDVNNRINRILFYGPEKPVGNAPANSKPTDEGIADYEHDDSDYPFDDSNIATERDGAE